MFSTFFFSEAVTHGLGAPVLSAEWDCAPPKSPLVSFVDGDQAASGSAACGRRPQPQNAELSAPTSEILVNGKTKPRSLGRDGLCPPSSFPVLLAQGVFFCSF